MVRISVSLVVLALVLAAFSVRRSDSPVLPETPYNYAAIALPSHLTVPPISAIDNTPALNPITDAGATLGRVLFYDTRLSLNETVSCASCHRQADGFSDPQPLSTGFQGGHTGRHSMSLAFSRYYDRGRFFWDERAATLEEQVLMPIQDGTEMGMSLPLLISKLQATDFYGGLFSDAFGSAEITSERISRALAQFVRSMVAPGSRYDDARASSPPGPPGQPLPGLTQQENQGLQIFFGRGECSRCHIGDLFVGDVPRNNGLDAVITDQGSGGGRFKTGSLRNIGVTAPYMHDGRFSTLEQVVEHYDSGIQMSQTLDPVLRRGNQPLRLNLTTQEKAALVAFLQTLTDPTFLADPRWSDPFNGPVSSEQTRQEAAVRLDLVGANPIRGTASLRVSGVDGSTGSVEAFDLAGRRVAVLHQGAFGSGALRWDTASLPSGTYVLRLVSNGRVASRTVTVLR